MTQKHIKPRRRLNMQSKILEYKKLLNKQINYLKPLEIILGSGKGVQLKCLCDCGKITISPARNVLNQLAKSCGCLRAKALSKTSTKHGKCKLKEYKIWKGMRQRCNHKNNHAYKDYGGRGINVAPEWDNFEVFLADMGKKPGENYTLERINNNLGYCGSNCKWATKKEQANNRRKRKSKKGIKECLICNKLFMQHHPSGKYCSLICFGETLRGKPFSGKSYQSIISMQAISN